MPSITARHPITTKNPRSVWSCFVCVKIKRSSLFKISFFMQISPLPIKIPPQNKTPSTPKAISAEFCCPRGISRKCTHGLVCSYRSSSYQIPNYCGDAKGNQPKYATFNKFHDIPLKVVDLVIAQSLFSLT